MREILFRGKRIDNGEWVIGYLWCGNDHVYITPSNFGIYYDDSRHQINAASYEVDRNKIGQYTGLEDKNGKRIFEGDILEFEKGGKLRKETVHFSSGCFSLGWRMYLAQTQIDEHAEVKNSLKIICNIHNNPELLDQQDD